MTKHRRLLSRSHSRQPAPISEFEALGWDPRNEDAEFLPELIVFDLDFTLWSCWIDTHTNGPPYRLVANNKVKDKYGDTMELFSEVPRVLDLIMQLPNTRIGVASRTDRAEWARQVLPLFEIQSDIGSKKRKLVDCIDFMEIYPGSKVTHFGKLARDSGVAYSRMMFFDDEARNREVERRLGVRFVHVDEEFGVNWNLFVQHLWSYVETRKHSQK